jgi:hypothetical protein
LEVACLDAGQTAPALAPPAAPDERTRLTVLVVAAETDLRRYVRECLRERTDLRLLEAATATAAVTLAARDLPALLVVDEPQRHVLLSLPQIRAIILVDDLPHESAPSRAHVRLLARPFTADRLVDEVDRLLG